MIALKSQVKKQKEEKTEEEEEVEEEEEEEEGEEKREEEEKRKWSHLISARTQTSTREHIAEHLHQSF